MNIQKINEGNPIPHAVVEYFLRVMKNYGYYPIITNRFNQYKKHNEDSPFGTFTDLPSFKKKIEEFTNKNMMSPMRSAHKNERQENYDFITNMINHMLHFFIEGNRNIKQENLGKYGQEIFDLVCYKLYGEQYIEDMKVLDQQPKMPSPNEIAFLKNEYEKLNPHMSFNDFLRMASRQMQKNAPTIEEEDEDIDDNMYELLDGGAYYINYND